MQDRQLMGNRHGRLTRRASDVTGNLSMGGQLAGRLQPDVDLPTCPSACSSSSARRRCGGRPRDPAPLDQHLRADAVEIPASVTPAEAQASSSVPVERRQEGVFGKKGTATAAGSSQGSQREHHGSRSNRLQPGCGRPP